jgi:hypothetical protein
VAWGGCNGADECEIGRNVSTVCLFAQQQRNNQQLYSFNHLHLLLLLQSSSKLFPSS